jgi:hypothetical protein
MLNTVHCSTFIDRRPIMAKVKAISPSEVVTQQLESFPPEVIEVFNQLIAEKFNGYDATVLQKDAVAALEKQGLDSHDIYDRGWLNVEDIYRKQGWKVEYDKPGYNESYPASFKFTKK